MLNGKIFHLFSCLQSEKIYSNGKYNMTHIINPSISDRQIQVIKGTILGGSSIVKPSGGKNCYLSMRSKNGKWLDFKAGELGAYSSQAPFTIEKTNRWHSLCYPIFCDLREKFYDGKKRKLTIEILDELRLKDVAFMIWYGDVGNYHKNMVTFNTNIWGKKGTEATAAYFATLGYKSTIVKERKSYRVRLDVDSSKSLIEMIEPHLPFSR
jgi:hypothetical protein